MFVCLVLDETMGRSPRKRRRSSSPRSSSSEDEIEAMRVTRRRRHVRSSQSHSDRSPSNDRPSLCRQPDLPQDLPGSSTSQAQDCQSAIEIEIEDADAQELIENLDQVEGTFFLL